jgi:hypothetical protein
VGCRDVLARLEDNRISGLSQRTRLQTIKNPEKESRRQLLIGCNRIAEGKTAQSEPESLEKKRAGAGKEKNG